MRKSKSYSTVFAIVSAIVILSVSQSKNSSFQHNIADFFSKLWNTLAVKNGNEIFQQNTTSIQSSDSLEYQVPILHGIKSKSHLTGKVIYRAPSTWNSFLWINLGEEDNAPLSSPCIAKNSPVLCGDSVVGVVEYVGRQSSLVRLISDSTLTPAVRVARGGLVEETYAHELLPILHYTQQKNDLFDTDDETKAFRYLSEKLIVKFLREQNTLFLAKGELQGQSRPIWRTPGQLLHGYGFNYTFKDSKGPSRDLRTGEPIDPNFEYESQETAPILQVGDLLFTSGMDGIFPEGLKIAKVRTIFPLREGAYAYEILAEPTCSSLFDLQYVTVLEPIKIEAQFPPFSHCKVE